MVYSHNSAVYLRLRFPSVERFQLALVYPELNFGFIPTDGRNADLEGLGEQPKVAKSVDR